MSRRGLTNWREAGLTGECNNSSGCWVSLVATSSSYTSSCCLEDSLETRTSASLQLQELVELGGELGMTKLEVL